MCPFLRKGTPDMSESSTVAREITLKVSESTGKDVGRGLARIDPADMQRLGLDVGDMVEVVGQKATICKLLPTFKEHRGKGRLQIDGIARENAGAGLGEWGAGPAGGIQTASPGA